MHTTALSLPDREAKPRSKGLTMVMDGGLPSRLFADLVESFGPLIDVVKFGWGTSVVTDDITYKIDATRAAGVDFYFGGTLFEKFLSQNRFDDWRRYCDSFGCTTVEVSNGTMPLPNEHKAKYVEKLAGDYRVFSEVGYKDPVKSETMRPQLWIDYIREDLAAGAFQVITEARESGSSGIYRPSGELRIGLIEEIGESDIDLDKVMFEAPTRPVQIHLIRKFGSDVSLGNVSHAEVIGLETLRLGLRGDTFDDFGPVAGGGFDA